MTYTALVKDELKIDTSSIFNNNNSLFDIFEKINNAANAMKGRLGDMTGINICIHVASSFVMLGSDTDVYHRAIQTIREKFKGVDPTIIVTAAALYYILKEIESVIKKYDSEVLKRHYIDYVGNKIKAAGKEFTKEKEQRIDDEFEDYQNQIDYICNRFDLMNWMIGECYMKYLDIEKKCE